MAVIGVFIPKIILNLNSVEFGKVPETIVLLAKINSWRPYRDSNPGDVFASAIFKNVAVF
jgi:hypothetical protein